MKRIFLCGWIATLGFLLNCKTQNPCPYFEGIQLYFSKTFDIDLTTIHDTNAYYLVPLESCENCIWQNLNMLPTLPKGKVTIVFVGKNYHAEWDNIIVNIKSKHPVLLDEYKHAHDYETGLNKPLLVVVKSGECHLIRNFTEDQLPELNDILVHL